MSSDEQSVISMIEHELPNPAVRDFVLNSLADAILVVNKHGPNSWGVNNALKLQFTWKAIQTPYIWWVNNSQAGEVMYHLDNEDLLALPEEDRNLLIEEAKLNSEDADWVKAYLGLPSQDKVSNLVKRLFESYIKKKIGDKPNKILGVRFQETHRKLGAATIEYLRNYLGRREIPQPGWYVNPLPQPPPTSGPDVIIGVELMSILLTITKHLEDRGYHFTRTQIASFYTALQTKGFVILSGISGTGKTKLAQEFARLLPQAERARVIPTDIVRIIIQPYMRKYSRMIIPKARLKLFNPPEPGKSANIELEFDGQKESCLLSHFKNPDTDYVHLLLKGKVRTWFLDNYPEKSEIGLELQFNTEGNLSGFKLASPDQFAQPDLGQKDDSPENILFLSVRPDWRDSKSLLGYYNPLTKTYQTTPFIEFLLKAKQSYKRDGLAWFLILDEMNLARVEYYFADLLSVLESGRDKDGYTIEALRFNSGDLEEGTEALPEEIHLPPNLYIVGTVNVDETTQAFSPKVLDRAFSIEFVDVNLKEYNLTHSDGAIPTSDERKKLLEAFTRDGKFAQIDKTAIGQFSHLDHFKQLLVELNESLTPSNHHFGYRVFDEIMMFLKNAEENGMFGDDLQAAFDQAVLMKVLPKFHGSRGKLEKPLHALLCWCAHVNTVDEEPVKTALANLDQPIIGSWHYPATAKRVLRMIQSLNSTGFASFG